MRIQEVCGFIEEYFKDKYVFKYYLVVLILCSLYDFFKKREKNNENY